MGLFSGIGDFVGGLLGGGDAGDAASQYYNQIPGTLKKYLGPYANRGNEVYPLLQKQLQQLMNNPGGLLNTLGQNYQQSPGYQFQVNQATGAANNAAAAGGMLGSPAHQQNVASLVNNLASRDYNQYLGNALNLFGRGLSGEQNIYNTGAGVSGNLGENLANSLMNQGNLAYTNAVNQNQMGMNFLGGLAGLAFL